MLSRDDHKAKLLKAIDKMLTDEGFQTLMRLRKSASLGRYSFNNQILVAAQSEGKATMCMGAKGWTREHKRTVKKEAWQNRIWIYAPVFRDGPEDGDGRKERFLVGFTPVYVFDIAQTDGPPVPVIEWKPSGIGNDAAFDRLAAYAEAQGCPVTFSDKLGNALGQFSPVKCEITISESAHGAAKINALIHEMAHWLQYTEATKRKHNYAEDEIGAELTAYMVADSLGLETATTSAYYIAHWANGDRAAILAQWQEADANARKLQTAIAA
jgi:hypothetical protein